jgi:hypothetical protein
MPTSQPTSSPTEFKVPEVVTIGGSASSTYFCRSDHIHSSSNPWQQIFGGLTLSSTTDLLKTAHVWIVESTYNNVTDGFAMQTWHDGNDFYNVAASNYIMTNVSRNHLWLEMAHQFPGNDFLQIAPADNTHFVFDYTHHTNTGQNRSWLINEVWTEILRMPAFKILSDDYDCETLIGTSRTVNLQLWDKRDRESAIYSHTLNIKTAGLIYSDEREIITTNDQSGEIFMSPNATLLHEVSEFFLV